MERIYTKANLEAQLSLAQKQLAGEEALLARLDQLHEDVRENHRRTINMRAAGYKARIERLTAEIESA